ncbi:MAG: hypothetical protein F6K21_07635 [Symploca sp. SIO2D2]|nr:hypothetical protein [Symploca sp. SIO2D2]NER25530.1 hypothetical protein [Symploca sp. SIO1C2]NET61494.1 hypothetical protein [Symploca sp. SIO2E6]
MEKEATRQVDQDQVEETFEQFDFDDYLLDLLETVDDQQQKLQILHGVFKHKSEDLRCQDQA